MELEEGDLVLAKVRIMTKLSLYDYEVSLKRSFEHVSCELPELTTREQIEREFAWKLLEKIEDRARKEETESGTSRLGLMLAHTIIEEEAGIE